ncbi:MAG: glycoside hydrolase family 3 protein [Lysobacteraceae bacterium]|nr:MAG: glycoside hydrolase family 3 protein [Xanthomonadaceae bacterium]
MIGIIVGADAQPPTQSERPVAEWRKVVNPIRRDASMEARIDGILSGMSLTQKIGQMTQAEIKSITPEEVRAHFIGSVLNGGGSWPGKNKHASVTDWLALADAYYAASMSTDMAVKIPIIWGTDAVHGHSNVYRATLFPHNIGLGAARDPALIHEIAAATASGVRASGIDWVFAPAVPVVQDMRWGRMYESYGNDPALIRTYADAYVRGLQGSFGEGSALASVKHFLGDGGTDKGKDQGQTIVTQRELVRTHAQGYFGGLRAGAQNIMVSYNSWKDPATGTDHGKMHGIRMLLTDALKEKVGFDGFLVSDWNAIEQIPGCTKSSCPQAVNAGVDMFMVPDDWKAFIENTVRQVEAGEIPMARIDDAVRRILRVKLRMGMFDGKAPSEHPRAGDLAALQHKDLARRAVRESLVLLKNDGALPIKPGARVLVVGKGADNIPMQAGGWSLTWQGDETTNEDYPEAQSLLAGLRAVAGDDFTILDGTRVGAKIGDYDVAIVVIGEKPYAEMKGDVAWPAATTHSLRYPEDRELLEAMTKSGKPVVTVFLSGRTSYVNDLLNFSNAFVAAWLPGSEGAGVADMLLAGAGGKPRYDFRGRTSFPWPGDPCASSFAPAVLSATPPRFPAGYGLSYARPKAVPVLSVSAKQSCGAR